MSDGYVKSAESRQELLQDLKRHWLKIDPTLMMGDGALGFGKALRPSFGFTRAERCWIHETANVLNNLLSVSKL